MRTCTVSRGFFLCLAMFFVWTNLTCRKSPQETAEDKPEPNAPVVADVNTPSESVSKDVVAIVNGVEIKESAIMNLIEPDLARIAEQGSKIPPAVAEQYKKQLREQALEQLIRRQLLDEKIKEANITVTDEDVMNLINEIASEQNMSLEDFKKTIIEQYNRNFEEIKEDYRRQLSRKKFMQAQWAGKTDVMEDEAKKYYDENIKRFDVPEQIRVSHILIQYDLSQPNADPNQAKAEAKAKAQDLLRQIKDGADFAEMAKAHSDCLSAPKGGDLGFFPRGESTPQFEKAAFELEIGKVSDIVETEYGCHIIKAMEHKDASVISYEQAKDDIIRELTEKKQLDFAEKYISELKAQAKIVFPSKL